MDRIVVGVDGSDGSRRALAWACDEAATHGWSVLAVTAIPNGDTEYVQPIPGARVVPVADFEDRTAKAEAELDRSIDAVVGGDAPIPIERAVVPGDPAQALVDTAHDAELLVLGARGLGAIRALVLGSVSQRCVTQADVPVVIVPPAADVA